MQIPETIHNAAGERLDYTLHTPDDAGGRPLVVIGHGVTANKDRAWAVALGEALAREGFPALRFSFAGNGDSEGDFRDCTVTKEVADAGAVLDAVGAADEDGRRVVFVGHSMGGAVGVLRASTDARIGWLVSLAGMVRTRDFAARKFGALTPGADVMWDKPECPLSQTFVDDMNAIDSVAPRAGQIEVPWLLVHGTADTVVPHEESVEVQQANHAAGGAAVLMTLDGADHLFGGDEAAMCGAVTGWLIAQAGA